jgi:glutamyl-Q tRNA(Asp) synthetase
MRSDHPVLWQSQRSGAYARALQQLQSAGRVYPCACTRREIADSRLSGSSAPVAPFNASSAPATGELVYPGTCRAGPAPGRTARALRVQVGSDPITWIDRRQGQRCSLLEQEVGDFVLRRADGLWAYQLAVVVDDAEQGITDIVRGDDLIDSTARQIYLQQLLGLHRPRYLHIPVVVAADGRKLSKQNGAQPLDLSQPLITLSRAAAHLGLNVPPLGNLSDWYTQAIACWRAATG